MALDGRVEKRVPKVISVTLEGLREPGIFENTITENVSPHGTRVLTKRFWRPGEKMLLTPLSGESQQLQLPVRVVYCRVMANGDVCVGLEFPDHSIKWAEWLTRLEL